MLRLKLLYFIFFARVSCIGRFYSLFLLFQGISFSQLGTILSVAYISRTVSNIVWSTISDMDSKYNWRYIIPQITSIISAILSLLLLLPHYWLHYNSGDIQLFVDLFIIQIIWYLFTTAEWPLVVGLTMIKLSKTNDKIKYGIYRSCGAISWGICHLIIGLCLQYNIIQLQYLIYMYIVLTAVFLLSYFVTFGNFKQKLLDIQATNYGSVRIDVEGQAQQQCERGSKWSTFIFIMSNPSRFSIFILLVCIAGGRDVLESFLFVYIYSQYENNPFLYGLLGISVIITVAFEFPLFLNERIIVKYLGFRTMMILGSIFLTIRFMAYTLLTNSTLIAGFLSIELLHGLSFALIDMSMVTICSDLFPSNMQMIAQGLLNITRNGIGPFIFVLIAGIIFDKYGGDWLFRGIAIVQIIAVLFFVLLTRRGKLKIATEVQQIATEVHSDQLQ